MANPSKKSGLASLMKKKLYKRSPIKSMQLIGMLIDMGFDEKCTEAVDYANTLLDEFSLGKIPNALASRAHYYRANICSGKRHASDEWKSWVWKSKNIDSEILELRRAIQHIGFVELDKVAQAQAYTNLGNILNHTGRFIEAIECWDLALSIIPRFAMASGNRGIGISDYGSALYDPGHERVLMLFAGHSLAEACDENAFNESPDNYLGIEYFSKRLNDIFSHYDLAHIDSNIDFEKHSMGRSKTEKEYRRWCLRNRLFINPLNDVCASPIAAQDVMTLPSITTSVKDGPHPPTVIHYFNILKQEYCAARYALYEAITASGVHYSDRKVLLLNTLDYPKFGFAVERMKMAFRGAYAVFDKTAFFLNSYFELGRSELHVNFRNVWFEEGKTKSLHPKLDGMANWPLRGLFWLSKDIFENHFKQVTDPDAQSLYELRNHMEHKFVSVHSNFFSIISPSETLDSKAGIFDISDEELRLKALRQLKLARATIMYLSLAVHAEERKRSHENPDSKLFPMHLDKWNDDWKRPE
jgi:tetratricopeptide (TPR) repeat protein